MKLVIIYIETICIFALLFALFSQFFGISWQDTILAQSCQTVSISDENDKIYCLSLIRQNLTLSTDYLFFVAPKGELNYGYVINYPELAVVGQHEIDSLSVVWTDAGVEISTDLKTEIFVPKNSYQLTR